MQVVLGVVQVPPHVGNGLPPEQCSMQKHAPSAVQVAFGPQVPSHVGKPLPPSQNGGRQVAGKPGRGPTQVQPGGHVPPHGPTGGSDAHAQ